MLEARTALITGAASGIGLETTRRFSTDTKYNPIYAVDRDPTIGEIFPSPDYPHVVPIQLDVTDKQQMARLLRRSYLETGQLNVVVNAAGIMSKGLKWTFWDKDGNPTPAQEEMDRVNLSAPISTMMMAAPIMRQNGGGVIVNVTSAKYLFPDIYHGEYQTGKRILSKVTKGLAKVFAEVDNIRLVDVQPGNTKTRIDRGVWTDGNNNAGTDAAQKVADWWKKTFGNEPKNVAEVIYEIAEGKLQGSPVYVGWDTIIGRFLYLLTYPLMLGYRSDYLFFVGSSLFYLGATGLNITRKKFTHQDHIS